jgi:Transcriptional regulator, AbiEi antitoxin, Type IV TA system/Transcriptional regulator, AbiEi antitoxin N-terminal domain
MTRPNESKLKWMLAAVLPGQLIDTPTLQRHGITRKLAHKYIESGWLQPAVRGLYRRPGVTAADQDWQRVVRSLQHVMGYTSVLGGRTALEAQGFAHYLPMRDEDHVHLYGDAHPSWLRRLGSADRFRLHTSKLFNDAVASETAAVSTAAGALTCSTPERAILELIDELPKHETFHIVDKAFEGLSSARPRRLEQLLLSCTSVKVKRLFFVFADRHAHAWRRHLSPETFDLGSGPRALVENGRFHPRYKISVPESLLPHEELADGA